MKRITIAALIILTVAALILGSELVSYLAGGRLLARRALKDKVPSQWEITRLTGMLTNLDRTLDGRSTALAHLQVQAENLDREIAVRKRDLSQDQEMLRRAAELLAGQKDHYVIAGVSYTHSEVDRDAVLKAKRYAQDQGLLGGRQQTRRELAQAIARAAELISDGEVKRQVLANQVEQLAIRAEECQVNRALDNQAPPSRPSAVTDAFTRTSRAIQELDARLRREEKVHAMRTQPADGIDYVARPPRSGLQAITEVLK